MRVLRLWQALWFVAACFFCPVVADVKILAPQQGITYSASSGTAQIEIAWENDGHSPGLDEIQNFKFLICTGPNEHIACSDELASVEPSAVTGNKYTLQVPRTVGANGAYYIQLYAALENGHSITYSSRFMLTGMVGSKPAGNDVSIPPPSHELQLEVNSASFSIPYTEQTGRTRFAPMQLQPGTSVTARTWTIRFPTSSVSYFSTIDSRLQQQSTITPGWSYKFTSLANPATPAPMPSENGSWYNPRSRLSFSPRKVNFKRVGGIPTPTVVNESL